MQALSQSGLGTAAARLDPTSRSLVRADQIALHTAQLPFLANARDSPSGPECHAPCWRVAPHTLHTSLPSCPDRAAQSQQLLLALPPLQPRSLPPPKTSLPQHTSPSLAALASQHPVSKHWCGCCVRPAGRIAPEAVVEAPHLLRQGHHLVQVQVLGAAWALPVHRHTICSLAPLRPSNVDGGFVGGRGSSPAAADGLPCCWLQSAPSRAHWDRKHRLDRAGQPGQRCSRVTGSASQCPGTSHTATQESALQASERELRSVLSASGDRGCT